MKKAVLSSVFILFLILAVIAQQATVVYTEGSVYVKDHTGASWDPDIGSQLVYNDTVLTGYNGFTELDTGSGTISIHSNSVFKFMQAGKGGEKQNVFSCMLGSVYLKVQTITGQGPRITSGSMAAGIRGTEFIVYSGVDGSSLIHVTKGMVEVTSEGRTVSVNADEAVEIKLGRPPGQKYTVKEPIDYSKWNQEKYDEFMKNPVASIKDIEGRMLEYIQEIRTLHNEHNRIRKILEAEYEKLKKIEEEQGKEAYQKYFIEQVQPIRHEMTMVYLNIRFHALSALSLRRFLAGRMYLFMKTTYINNPNAKIYQDFLAVHKKVIGYFSKDVLEFIDKYDM
ncbi:MAG: FecR domain-containing protein [Spirochaetales bacterium]|nr:FecR domain-containing protein [Spirochaetales bacterium]